MLSERKQVWGQRDGYVGKVFIDQTQGPEFESPNPHFKKQTMWSVPALSAAKRRSQKDPGNLLDSQCT